MEREKAGFFLDVAAAEHGVQRRPGLDEVVLLGSYPEGGGEVGRGRKGGGAEGAVEGVQRGGGAEEVFRGVGGCGVVLAMVCGRWCCCCCCCCCCWLWWRWWMGEMQGDGFVDGEVGEGRFGVGGGDLAEDGGPEGFFLGGGEGGQEAGPGSGREAAAWEEDHGLVDDPALGSAVEEDPFSVGCVRGVISVSRGGGEELVGEGLEEVRWERVQPCPNCSLHGVLFRFGRPRHGAG